MARTPDVRGCEWPREICPELPTQQDPQGAAFCAEHYKAWGAEMEQLLLRAALVGKLSDR
jgi:hypothetical protein